MLARVAAAFHVIDGRQGDAIEGDTMQTAARFMRKVRRHAAALYMHVLESSHVMEVARALARAIAADGGKPASIGRNYMVQHCRAFRSADDFPRRLAVMDRGCTLATTGRGVARLRRMGLLRVAVNPAVFDRYAEEGATHRERRAAVREQLE